MDKQERARRQRRSFTDEFKAGAVRLVMDQGKSIAEVARDLDLTASALAVWVEQARADRSKGKTGQDGADDGRARGAGEAAPGESRAAHGARPVKKSRGLLREGDEVKFAIVDAEKADYPVAKQCAWLGVSRSGYYAWRARPPSQHARTEERLRVQVREAHERSREHGRED